MFYEKSLDICLNKIHNINMLNRKDRRAQGSKRARKAIRNWKKLGVKQMSEQKGPRTRKEIQEEYTRLCMSLGDNMIKHLSRYAELDQEIRSLPEEPKEEKKDEVVPEESKA